MSSDMQAQPINTGPKRMLAPALASKYRGKRELYQ